MRAGVAVVARDPATVERVRRLAAIAGAAVDGVVDRGPIDRGAVRRLWRQSRLVLVDASLADELGGLDLGRRDGVVLLAADTDSLEAWRAAARLGAERVLAPLREEQQLLDLIAAASDPADGPPGSVVGVLPGSGGAGASTFAVALAVQAAAAGR